MVWHGVLHGVLLVSSRCHKAGMGDMVFTESGPRSIQFGSWDGPLWCAIRKVERWAEYPQMALLVN